MHGKMTKVWANSKLSPPYSCPQILQNARMLRGYRLRNHDVGADLGAWAGLCLDAYYVQAVARVRNYIFCLNLFESCDLLPALWTSY